MSPATGLSGGASSGFPRVSGDEPPRASQILCRSVFSPRERG
nr:MAG TPA: hypothetical protein [Caudoviricetes sp.]